MLIQDSLKPSKSTKRIDPIMIRNIYLDSNRISPSSMADKDKDNKMKSNNNNHNNSNSNSNNNIANTTRPKQMYSDPKNKITRNINFIHTQRRFNFDITNYSSALLDLKNANNVFKQFYQSNMHWGAYVNKPKPVNNGNESGGKEEGGVFNSNSNRINNDKQKVITLNLHNTCNNNIEIQQLNYLQHQHQNQNQVEYKRSMPIQSLKLYFLEKQQRRWESNPSNFDYIKNINNCKYNVKLNSYMSKSPIQKQPSLKSMKSNPPPSLSQYNNNKNNNSNSKNNTGQCPNSQSCISSNNDYDSSTLPILKEDALHPPSLKKHNIIIESPNKHHHNNNNKTKAKEDFIRLKDDLNYYTPKLYNYYIIHPENCGYLIKRCLNNRLNWRESQHPSTFYYHFQWKDCSLGINYTDLSSDSLFNRQCVNHFEYHSSLSNKANMFHNLMRYCEENNKEVFQYIPFTIVLTNDGTTIYNSIDSFKQIYDNIANYIYDYIEIQHKRFSRKNISYHSLFQSKDLRMGLKSNIMIPKTHIGNKNLWILKAPNLNRGRGIKLIHSFDLVNKYVRQLISGKLQDYSDENDKKLQGIDTQTQQFHSNKIIIQKYVEKPLLYYNRKFDIRIWVIITHKFEVYAFKEGHLKVCSVDYNSNDNNPYIHLTNYSLQKYNQDFSKYEKGNEVSFDLFQEYIDAKYSDRHLSVKKDFFVKCKEIIEYTCRSIRNKINPCNRKECFEIFGYDFLMDEDFNSYLIEINTNPGLEESSEIIKCLIPRMLDDALRLTVDEIYQCKYKEEYLDEEMRYVSPYKVKGYEDRENMWDYVCDLNKVKEKDKERICVKVRKRTKRKNDKEDDNDSEDNNNE